mmetsp:Transcript_24221/g.76728  ORF Transcript_24221/g.76728 Transcript_24221/m.76728 type:complete len:276 (+) Transcript_24221:1710-2537(+)
MRALWAARWRRTTHIAAGGATWGWQKGSNRSGRGRCRASQPSQAPHGLPSPAASPRARAPRPTRGHQAARRAAQTSRSGMQTASKQVSVHSSSRRGARPRSRRRVPLAPWTNPSSNASARERTSSAAPRSDCAHPKSRSRLYSGSPAASCRHARAKPHRPACSLELRRTEATGWVRCVQTHTGTAAGRSICHCTMVSADAMLPSAAAARGGATRTTLSRAPSSRSSEADPLSARRATLRPSAAASVPRRSPTSKTRASWLGSAAAEATGAHSVAK